MENQNKKILFSVIIPTRQINEGYIKETYQKLEELENQNFEVVVLPDEINNNQEEKTLDAKIISTGKIGPAEKRDLAVRHAKGKFLAFIDDDAYPEKNWLNTAEKYLKDDTIAAIGGPQLTPENDSFWQKASGAMFLSPLSGAAIIRFWPSGKAKEIDDWPTVNFIIKKEDFEKIGGFDTKYWPGEDTKLCLDIIKKLNKKILYIPELKVYHHRRSGLLRHLKQIGGYGLHRGYFAKIFPETSMRFSSLYFMPSLFLLFLIFGAIGSFFSSLILNFFLWGLAVYFSAVLIATLIVWVRIKNILISLASIPYLILFHLWYGIRFIQGAVFTKKLRSKLRSE